MQFKKHFAYSLFCDTQTTRYRSRGEVLEADSKVWVLDVNRAAKFAQFSVFCKLLNTKSINLAKTEISHAF